MTRLETFDQAVRLRIDGANPVDAAGLLGPTNQVWDVDGNDEEDWNWFQPMEPDAVQDKADDYTAEAYDTLLSAQVMLLKEEGLVRAHEEIILDWLTQIRFLIPDYMKSGLMTDQRRSTWLTPLPRTCIRKLILKGMSIYYLTKSWITVRMRML
jgi:hypothetical protein